MKWYNINIARLALAIGMLAQALTFHAQTTNADTTTIANNTDSVSAMSRYEKRVNRYVSRWNRFIPNQAVLQYAGSIGLINAGFGWHYGRNKSWETELLVGVLPKYHSASAHFTFTAKERFTPWHCHINPRWTIEPLTTGVFFNTISGEDFWRRQPSRYPKNYYWFSTKVRTNIFIGQRVRFRIPDHRRFMHQYISLYYEISTCDLYLASKFNNKSFPWRETLSLAIGLKWDI